LLVRPNPGVWRVAYRLRQPQFQPLSSNRTVGHSSGISPAGGFYAVPRLDRTLPGESRVKSLPKALIIGWLCAASWGTPLARADESESRGNESPCSQPAGSGRAPQQVALAGTAKAPEAVSASQEPNLEYCHSERREE